MMDSDGSGKTCMRCNDLVDAEDTLRCSLCSRPHHFGCVGVTTDDFKNALQDGSALWKCSSCLEPGKTSGGQPPNVDVKSLEVAIVREVSKLIDVRLKKLEKFQASQLIMHEMLSSQLKAIQSELSYLAVSKSLEDEKEEENSDEPPKTEIVGVRQRVFSIVSFMIPIIKKMKDSPCGQKMLKQLPKLCIKLYRRVFSHRSLLPQIEPK